jgi:LmbE family N-acetylglucosaminyl deacetylase
MKKRRSILSIFAHPDDESYGIGGTLAKYHQEGVRLTLVTLTDGGSGSKRLHPGILPDAPLGECRLKELEMACEVLGIDRLVTLGFRDGGLHETDQGLMISKIVPVILEERPDIIITFHPNGLSGHKDHIAATRVTKAAFFKAAEKNGYLATHQAKKLYYYTLSPPMATILRELYPQKDYYSVRKNNTTTIINVKPFVQQRLQALKCHQTQFSMEKYVEDVITARFYREYFQRYYPAPMPKEPRETDLFEGIE